MKQLLCLVVFLLLLMPLKSFANEASQRLIEMSERKKAEVMQRLLVGSGKRCKAVVKTLFLGKDKNNAAYWSVGCLGNRDYQVQIPENPNTNTRILECEVLKVLKIDCWKKF